MFSSHQPLTSAKNVQGRCSEQCLTPELFAADVPGAAHLTRSHGLRNGPFHSGALAIRRSELGSQLTCSGLMKSPIGLFVGLQDQHACGTVRALLMERTCLTDGLRKSHPNHRFAMPIANGAPTLTGTRSRTDHLMGLPINSEPAVIKARGCLGLPAHVWGHRPADVVVIARVTLGKHISVDIAHIQQMLLRKHFLLG